VRRHHEPSDSILDNFRNATNPSAHDGSLACHRFNQADPERFDVRAGDHDITLMDQLIHVGPVTEEFHAMVDSEFVGLYLKCGAVSCSVNIFTNNPKFASG